MARPVENRASLSGLDDLAPGHYADPLGHPADDRQVMGDQQQRHAEPVAQIAQQS